MKGSLEGVLPLLALFIIAGTVSLQSIPIAGALSEVLSDSTSDINRVIDSRIYGEYYIYNSIPQVAEYATNDAAFNQGQKEGQIEWNSSETDDYDNIMDKIKENWRNETEYNFNAVLTPSEGNNCNIVEDDDQEYDIHIYPNTNDFRNIRHDYTSIEPNIAATSIETYCDFGETTSSYEEEIEYNPPTEVTSNRYMQLADETARFFLDLQDELEDVDTATATEEACGTEEWSSAESSAVSSLESNVENALDNVKSNYPNRSYFELEDANIVTPSYTYNRGTTSNIVEGTTEETGPNELRDCDCDTCYEPCDPDETDDCNLTCYDEDDEPYDCRSYDCPPCDTRYEVEVEAEPTYIELEWHIKDNDQSIIVRGSSENLEFLVDSYEHEFQ